MDLYLVRHGITAWNVRGRYQGWADPDLTPQGIRQARQTATWFAAERAAGRLRLAALYTSPLRRAAHTAAIIGAWLGLAPQPVANLREMHGGAVEGLTQAEWHVRFPALVPAWRDAENWEFAWPGGETRRSFRARCLRGIAGIVERHVPAEQVLVVAHGGVIGAYLTAAYPAARGDLRAFDVANCSITQVQLGPPDAAAPLLPWAVAGLPRFNNVQHLAETAELLALPGGGPPPATR